MKGFLKGLWFSLLFVAAVGVFAIILRYQFRYHYLTVEDAHFQSSLLDRFTLSQKVDRPVRFDRWTGKVEIYVGKGQWTDMAQWNEDKYQKIQTSLKELTSVR